MAKGVGVSASTRQHPIIKMPYHYTLSRWGLSPTSKLPTAPNSLSIWTYNMKKAQVVDSFVSEGAPMGTAGIGAIILYLGVS
ncbi:hypothetical protein FBU30_005975 [Linnemannia zychae]|nr:hypothetical protein FBU30_005975 [Linnemannia zychae]